ncbi:MAG: LytTR family transcriptional regulator [Clostridiales bacterium]|nr:LytTR family transcriptional regulator [Clostridiales bacterium]
MNIKMMLDPDDPMRDALQGMGITDDPASEYCIFRKSRNVGYIQGRKEDQTFYVDVKTLIFIESLGHDIILHTRDGAYRSSERLKSLESILDPGSFLRISNSVIVNLKEIKRIESSVFQRFVLHLTSGDRVDVTRSYYYIFKEKIGI